jgi:hypothetical protein
MARKGKRKRTLTIILIAAPVLVVCALIATGVVWYDTITANRAQPYIDPFVSKLESLGAHEICGDGDAGDGWDNTTPWYQVYYLVPNSATTASQLKSVAARNGYTVHRDTTVPNGDVAPAEAFDDPTIAHQLQVSIYRDTGVPLDCADASPYGRSEQVSGSDAIVYVSVGLAPNHF